MKRVARKGFTLVEILIVVIILGILAAIVIPQFTQASSEARISNLMTNLQTIRSQLLLYKTQHMENYPDADFEDQMTKYSNIYGATVDTPDTDHPFGPYLQTIPDNPISGKDDLRIETVPFVAPLVGADGGWWFNNTTGQFKADLEDGHTTSDETTKLNDL